MNEISIIGKLQIVDSGQTDIGDVTKTISLSTAGQKGSGGQTVTTTASNLTLAAPVTWSNVGILWLRNQSTTAGEDVKLLKSAIVFARIKPGEAFPFRPEPDGTTWQVQSATGSPFLSHLASGTTTP